MYVKRKKPFLCKNINHFKSMRKSVLTTIWCLIAACSLGATDFVWKTGSPMRVDCVGLVEPGLQSCAFASFYSAGRGRRSVCRHTGKEQTRGRNRPERRNQFG